MARTAAKKSLLYVMSAGDNPERDGYAIYTEDEMQRYIDETDLEDYDGQKVWTVTLGKPKKLKGETWSVE